MTKKKDTDVVSDVLHYLTTTNRPYSSNDIQNNMKKEYGKTAITRALESLANDGRVLEKTYGKQKVYVIQQEICELTSEQIDDMDAEISKQKDTYSELSAKLKTILDELSKYQREMSCDELRLKTQELYQKNKEIEELLLSITNRTKVITKEERVKVETELATVKAIYTKRKRMAMDMINNILESSDQRKSDFMEELGIETDEAAGFVVPIS